jgi:hypothetical protein
MNFRNFCAITVVFVALSAVAVAQIGPGSLKAGAAKADISPPKEMFPMNAGQNRTVMVTQASNGIGYIPTDAAYLLPSEKAVGNRIKPGCAEPAIINGFLEMMRDFLAVPR